MFRKAPFFRTLVGLGFLLGTISGAIASQFPEGIIAAEPGTSDMNNHTTLPPNQFQRIEQPIGNKIAVTLGGLGLIGLELWWFLLSKPKAHQATIKGTIQEVTVTVDGGYEPSQIVVHAGQPVRLNFHRTDPSACLEEVHFPDFHIAQELPLNQVTAIEFTPEKPGRYEFTCGMNMFRGIVEVQPANTTTGTPSPVSSHPTHSSKHTGINIVIKS